MARAHPELVLLFGSQARGTAGPDSDIDLLVVLKEPRDRELRYALVDEAIGVHRWPVDLLVRSPDEIEARLRMGDPFYRKILARGIALHES